MQALQERSTRASRRDEEIFIGQREVTFRCIMQQFTQFEDSVCDGKCRAVVLALVIVPTRGGAYHRFERHDISAHVSLATAPLNISVPGT